MFYPEELIEEVRQKSDIVDVISGYVSLQKKGSNYMCCCPFHGEKTPDRKNRFAAGVFLTQGKRRFPATDYLCSR